MAKDQRLLIFFILFFILSRLALLLFPADKICSGYLNLNGEEQIRGTIARELIQGLKMPFFNYRADNYSGGSLVVGIITVPFFLLFGQNIISLKLTAVTFSALILIFFYLFCDKFFNRRVAVIASFLFILSPKIFTVHSLVTMGFHSESILFSLTFIFLFYQIFCAQKISYLYFFLLGLVGGFGLWFTYIFAVTLIVAILFWFNFERKFILKKEFYLFLSGFLIGFSPCLWFNFTHHFKGLEIIQQILNLKASFLGYKSNPTDRLASVVRELVSKEPRVWDFTLYLNAFYFLIFFISFCYLLWRDKKSIAAFFNNVLFLKKYRPLNLKQAKYSLFLIYTIIFWFIYFLVSVGPGERYLIPSFPFIFLIIALFLDSIWHVKIKKVAISLILVAVLIFIGVVNQAKLFFLHDQFGKGFDCKGYSYFALAGDIYYLDDDCLLSNPMAKEAKRLIEQLKGEDRDDFAKGLICGLYGDVQNQCTDLSQDLEKGMKIIAKKANKKEQDYLYYQLGEEIAFNVLPKDEKAGWILINRIDTEHKAMAEKGFQEMMACLKKVFPREKIK